MMSYILAGACHDVDHPGVNNIFLIESRDKLAIRYNDVSVLENHHVALSFDILQSENGKYNMFENLDQETFKRVRKLMIGAILATDMSNHLSKLAVFKSKILSNDFDAKSTDNKKICAEWIFHLADISNSSKPFKICQKWTDLLFVEFFDQGDREHSADVTIQMFMDRYTTNIASS